MDGRLPILNVGSGPGGLSMALALGRGGIPCMLIDECRPSGAAQVHLHMSSPGVTPVPS